MLRLGQILNQRFREIDDGKRQLFEVMSTRDATLKELRPPYQERLAAMRQTASRTTKEAQKKAGTLPQRQIAEAEKQRQRRPKLLASINLGGNGLQSRDSSCSIEGSLKDSRLPQACLASAL